MADVLKLDTSLRERWWGKAAVLMSECGLIWWRRGRMEAGLVVVFYPPIRWLDYEIPFGPTFSIYELARLTHKRRVANALEQH